MSVHNPIYLGSGDRGSKRCPPGNIEKWPPPENKEPSPPGLWGHEYVHCLFMVRVAQGLVHMGKGTIGINPFFRDRQIMSQTAVAGLLATLVAFTDAKAFILDKSHWMLYFLVTAMFPRFLITLDEDLQSIPVTARVG
ncbi:uncharacterized protein EI90DRAFT_3285234 [Cantharellus anzutake]|uniref:uncharacterized protein n=1 Tax=Cantharellus anzutake TaxID=1750568 RepID=UPI0019070514|nr:uncharacterized protein EI90DRAFT_3285234 [Cantharellus anzutake]KAF8342083.1 hypothetical protein EI90DRAFT_3285234 [Cantharellus anzutake]